MTAAAQDYVATIATRVREESRALSLRWLNRLTEVLAVARDEIFPSNQLLDHIPHLVHELASYIESPAVEELAANTSVVAKARELGLLRHAQKASVHQLLREYHLLGAILEDFVLEETRRLAPPPDPADALIVSARISHALRILQQTTIDTFIAEYTETISAQQARLEGFNRLVSHELRQPLGTLQFSVRALRSGIGADPERSARLLDVVERSANRLVTLTEQLERISGLRSQGDGPGRQEIHISVVAREVARQLRDMAELRDVDIRVADDLPTVVADAARLELVLVNLISNAIKYSDPAKPQRHVEIFLSGATDDGRTICVRDNGLGIPADAMTRVFEGFYRAHAHLDGTLGTQGTGLGLAIVAECIEALGGRISAASVEGEGTSFDVWLPGPAPLEAPDPTS
ncbi:MAG: HAMP domain-containing sensor histidine kinase [Acidobacteriota bacterium]